LNASKTTKEVKDLKNKGAIITVLVVAAALVVSAGIAIAAGVSSSGGQGNCAVGETAEGVRAANQFRLSNEGEDCEIRNQECAETMNGECDGDCERDRDRECLQDGSCDGDCDGEGNQYRNNSCPMVDEAGAVNASSSTWNGNCNGDCDRDQDCLQDGSCDGDCDLTQTRSGRRTGAE
jgi:hypothetical protein